MASKNTRDLFIKKKGKYNLKFRRRIFSSWVYVRWAWSGLLKYVIKTITRCEERLLKTLSKIVLYVCSYYNIFVAYSRIACLAKTNMATSFLLLFFLFPTRVVLLRLSSVWWVVSRISPSYSRWSSSVNCLGINPTWLSFHVSIFAKLTYITCDSV